MQICGRACLLVVPVSCRLVDLRLSGACGLAGLVDNCHVDERSTLPQNCLPQNCQHTGVALRSPKLLLFTACTHQAVFTTGCVVAADARAPIRSPTSCTAVLAW